MKTESYIIVKNCTADELKIMLNDWLMMYTAGLKSKMTFGIAKPVAGTFALKVDKSIDDTDFFYMVNYFFAPLNFDKTFEAEGYATATKHKTLAGKNIYVFINAQDKEYDNVWITTEDGETYKFDFGGKFKKMDSENYYKTLDTINLSIIYEQIHIDKKELLEEAKRREEEKSRRSTAKRFKIMATVLFVLISLAYLINNHFPYVENGLLIWISSFAVTIWFLTDYKIFYNAQRTLVCVLLSLLNITLGINAQDIFAIFITVPLSSIIVMLVTNKFLGIKIGKILDSHGDRLFILALLAISVLISVFVFKPVLEFLNITPQ